MQSGNLCLLAVEKNSAQQSWCESRIPRTIQNYFVLLVDLVSRVGQPLRKFAVVGKKDQAFGLRIEPAHIEKTGKFRWQKIKDNVARMRIASGRNETGGLVQNNVQARKLFGDEFAIHLHVVAD